MSCKYNKIVFLLIKGDAQDMAWKQTLQSFETKFKLFPWKHYKIQH